MKYLTVFYQNGHDFAGDPVYDSVDIDCEMFTRPDNSNDVLIVNGAVIRLPGTIVDVRPRMTGKKGGS